MPMDEVVILILVTFVLPQVFNVFTHFSCFVNNSNTYYEMINQYNMYINYNFPNTDSKSDLSTCLNLSLTLVYLLHGKYQGGDVKQ